MMCAVYSVYTHANKKHENQHSCTYPITKQRSTALGHIQDETLCYTGNQGDGKDSSAEAVKYSPCICIFHKIEIAGGGGSHPSINAIASNTSIVSIPRPIQRLFLHGG